MIVFLQQHILPFSLQETTTATTTSSCLLGMVKFLPAWDSERMIFIHDDHI
jgi:hypothetical protein